MPVCLFQGQLWEDWDLYIEDDDGKYMNIPREKIHHL